MLTITLNMYQTAGVAMLLFVLGRFLTTRIDFLKRCCIPAPVVGGLIFALAHLALYMGGVVQFTFDDNVKNFFMTLFFTSVGYTACFRLLKKGGKKVFTFLLIAIVMVFLQDVLGSVLAAVFHWDMRLGLCTASIPMVGGHGTAGSYGPMMENELGIAGANVLAVAAATYGLVAGSLMGGPTARSIIQRYNLTSTENDSEIMEISDETAEEKARAERVDVDSFTNAAILLIVASGIGTLLTALFNAIKIGPFTFTFPTYIGAMVIAAIIRNFCDSKRIVLPSTAIDIWGSVSLSIFLAIALMTLKLWELAGLVGGVLLVVVCQVIFMILVANFVVFRVLGRNYDAAVMCAGLCGHGLGATPSAIVNMTAVTEKYGMSRRAFMVVPIVGAFLVDIIYQPQTIAFIKFFVHGFTG